MANEIFEGESLSLELTRFLDKNVGTEKSSAASINCLLKDFLKKKKCLETEVSDLGKTKFLVCPSAPPFQYFTCKEFKT